LSEDATCLAVERDAVFDREPQSPHHLRITAQWDGPFENRIEHFAEQSLIHRKSTSHSSRV
jgi:hypothetical protein